MLAHQLAASHRLGMTFIDKATTLLNRFDLAISGQRPVSDAQVNSIEAARLANAASRMMAAYHDGLLALDRIRRGGKQTVKVVHVHQQVAVVAGTMKAGGPKQRKRTGGGPKKWRMNPMQSVCPGWAGSSTAPGREIGTTPPVAAPRPGLARPAEQQRCRMVAVGCTGARAPARARRRASSAFAHRARSMVATAPPLSLDAARPGPLSAPFACSAIPMRPPIKSSRRWRRSK